MVFHNFTKKKESSSTHSFCVFSFIQQDIMAILQVDECVR